MEAHLLTAKYNKSWALVIGINEYEHASPLEFACNDAKGVRDALISDFEFPDSDVKMLLDEQATREGIMQAFLDFASEKVQPDDRVLVFFAGHGITRTSSRGEVGFLVPVDGESGNLETLIRWDELTRNCDLIQAKHVFFVMDACYGGLALSRGLAAGSMRFLKDMLRRPVRQVLTAGKADEAVADSGGPMANHSMFTGHFLQAIKGEAAVAEGVITANNVMAYVYEKVANDQHSRQTPHYGFLDGDGDFIFKAEVLNQLESEPETDQDVLIPISAGPSDEVPPAQDSADLAKEYISDSRYRIKLHDLVTKSIRSTLQGTSLKHFPTQTTAPTAAEFAQRLRRYEESVERLQSLVVCLAHWCEEEQIPLLGKAIGRMADQQDSHSGMVVWINLRLYPATLLLYSGGIAALAVSNYKKLAAMLHERVSVAGHQGETRPVLLQVGESMLELVRSKAFKLLPDHERHYSPQSEYLFKLLQPNLDNLLFLGQTYEALFDRFEVLLALVHADSYKYGCWGPYGRFAWKYRSRGRESNPFTEIVEEGKSREKDWAPLRAGLFGGSFDRFSQVAAEYEENIRRVDWF